MNTRSFKQTDISPSWILVDAKNKILGNLAAKIASRLRGKHKPEFTPNSDLGDFIVVINAGLINVTGKKLTQKKYFRHSGYPGGIKSKTLERLHKDYFHVCRVSLLHFPRMTVAKYYQMDSMAPSGSQRVIKLILVKS